MSVVSIRNCEILSKREAALPLEGSSSDLRDKSRLSTLDELD